MNQTQDYLATSKQLALVAFEKLPPEAIVKVVDLVADIARANKILEGKDQEFQQFLTMLREKNLDRKERLSLLGTFMSNPNLSEKDVSMIVSAICNIAEGKSG